MGGAFKMPVTPGNTIRLQDMVNLAGLANSKLSLQTLKNTHYPYSFNDWNPVGNVQPPDFNPSWLTELNNLRADLAALSYPAALPFQPGDPRYAAKGLFLPTPGFSTAYLNNTFFFEFKGSPATVTFAQGIQGSSITNSTTFNTAGLAPDFGLGDDSPLALASIEGGFIIPGPNPVTITGEFYTLINSYDGSDPSQYVEVTSDLGIGTRKIFTATGAGAIPGQAVLVWEINNQVVAPGTYIASVKVNNTGVSCVHSHGFSMVALGFISQAVNPPVGPTCSTSFIGGAPVNGIDKNFPVYALPVGIVPPVFYFLFSIPSNANAAEQPPYPQPIYPTPYYQFPGVPPNNFTVSTSVPGLWAANVTAVENMNFTQPSDMPWNLEVTALVAGVQKSFNPMITEAAQPGGSYVDKTVVELQSNPPLWKPITFFPLGFTIQDNQGNFQQVSIAGISGRIPPPWFQEQGTITDGSITWTLVKKPASSVTPAIARPLSIPRYPVYWNSETIPALKPPTSFGQTATIFGWGNQWFSTFSGNSLLTFGWQQGDPGLGYPNGQGLAYGWFIYSFTVNRVLGNVINGLPMPNNNGIPVQIGCIRNGAFVSFGNFSTGGTYQVLWPIFTSDALVYQASERVDIQAVAIKLPTTAAIMGPIQLNSPDQKTSFPIAAAFYNDTEALLNLIS